MPPRLLVVDHDPDMLSTCCAALEGFDVVGEPSAAKARERLGLEAFDLLLSDIRMPELSGIELLTAARAGDPELPVILMTAFPEVETAIDALRLGAVDYLVKPFHPDDLRSRVARAIEERRLKGENRLLSRHVARGYMPAEIVGESPAIRRLLGLVDKVASTPADVLILGESGTGKELVAKRLHARSGRGGPFVPVDCGAIPENLLENEFFGHEKGAYTGAMSATPGLMEFANRGSFFLDEVCELPLSLQAKLLRALQERQFRRVGSNVLRSSDIRVIAATNRDVHREVEAGRFREDLYYRLNVITIHLPPLRERREDIPVLVRHFLPAFAKEMGKPAREAAPAVLEAFAGYHWPGNIRELQNALKKALVVSEGSVLKAADLPSLAAATAGSARGEKFNELKKKRISSFEKQYFESLLKEHAGDVQAAAKDAGLPVSNFYWYLTKHQLKPSSFR